MGEHKGGKGDSSPLFSGWMMLPYVCINLKKKTFLHKKFFKEKQRTRLSQKWAEIKSSEFQSVKLPQITINK